MEDGENDLPEDPVPAEFAYHNPVPVLFGHCWKQGEPQILNTSAACLDFNVAWDGFLTEYRWSTDCAPRTWFGFQAPYKGAAWYSSPLGGLKPQRPAPGYVSRLFVNVCS